MEIKLKDKTIVTRKWKGKDKKNFIAEMIKEKPNEKEIMNTLVHDCIETINGKDYKEYKEKVAFSPDEFKYIISMIRSESLGDDVTYNFFCTACKQTSERIYHITDILRPKYEEGNTIYVDDIEIVIGEIKNPDFYYKKIEEDSIYDFLLRIESINGNESFSLDQLIEYFDDLDVKTLDEILIQFNKLKFKVDDLNEFVCDCSHREKFYFDEIPEFFPTEWFNVF